MTNDKAPREFWLSWGVVPAKAVEIRVPGNQNLFPNEEVHVIEYSAYESMRTAYEKNKELASWHFEQNEALRAELLAVRDDLAEMDELNADVHHRLLISRIDKFLEGEK